jgi:DNA-binding response OmpR family regulator
MGLSILMVEDGQRVGEFVARFLQKEGYEVMCASSGEEGLRLFRDTPPDVVLLDLVLPGISGLEVLRQIKLVNPAVPVIMVTAHATVAIAVEAMRLGALDFLAKPIDLEALCAMLNKALSLATAPGAVPRPIAPTSVDALADVLAAQKQVSLAAGRSELTGQESRPTNQAQASSLPAPAPERRPPRLALRPPDDDEED